MTYTRKHAVSRCQHCSRPFLHRADKRTAHCSRACARLAWVNKHPDDELPELDQHSTAERLREGFELLERSEGT